MKRLSIVLLFVLCSVSGLFSQADTLRPPSSLSEDLSTPADRELFVWGGTTVPYLPREFSHYWKSGWNGGAGYGLSFAPGALGYGAVAVVVEYNRCPFDESGYRTALTALYPGQAAAIQSGIVTARGAASSLTAMLEFKGAFSPTKRTVAPYFLLAVGYMHFKSDSIVIGGSSSFAVPEHSESGVAWSFGLGVEIPLTRSLGIFVQGRSVIAQLDKTRQYFPLSAGFKMSM